MSTNMNLARATTEVKSEGTDTSHLMDVSVGGRDGGFEEHAQRRRLV